MTVFKRFSRKSAVKGFIRKNIEKNYKELKLNTANITERRNTIPLIIGEINITQSSPTICVFANVTIMCNLMEQLIG